MHIPPFLNNKYLKKKQTKYVYFSPMTMCCIQILKFTKLKKLKANAHCIITGEENCIISPFVVLVVKQWSVQDRRVSL